MFKNFLNTHDLYELRFRSDLFPSVEDRAFWDAFQNEECISLAETEADYAWPIIKATDFMEFVKSGDRDVMERPHFDRREHLCLFVLAELKENRGRFLPQIVNGLFAICEESYWGLSAHTRERHFEYPNIPTPAEPFIDLFAAETAEHLAMTVTLLEAPLLAFCPEIIDRVAYELNRRIKEPYENHFDFHWMGHRGKAVNNWNPWILSNVLTVFLLCEQDARRKARAVRKILWDAQSYYDTIPADGGCDEGPMYWNRAGATLFELLYQLKLSTDGTIDFFSDEKICRVASYMQKAHLTKDLFVNVADAHAQGLGFCMPLLFGFAKETNNEPLQNLSVGIYRERTSEQSPVSHKIQTLRRIVLASAFLSEMERYEVTYPLHGDAEILPDLELATLRKRDWILSAKGGHNEENHNHNDVGSFVLYEGDTPILVDVGINTYTKDTFSSETRYVKIPWTRGSYHNIPIVNGQEQSNGRSYRSDRFEAEDAEIRISFESAYAEDAGLSSLCRTLTLSDEGCTLTDRFGFASEDQQTVKEVFMSILPVRAEGNTVILGERYRLSASAGDISLEWVPFEDARLSSDWKTDGVTRILVECENRSDITVKVERI